MVSKIAICCVVHTRVKGQNKWYPTTKYIWNKLHARWKKKNVRVTYDFCDFCCQEYEISSKR